MLSKSFSTCSFSRFSSRVALDHQRVGVDHQLQLLDAGDVLADDDDDLLARIEREVEVHRHHHRPPAQLERELRLVAARLVARLPEEGEVEFHEEFLDPGAKLRATEPLAERVVEKAQP